jgi:hypothetical protein
MIETISGITMLFWRLPAECANVIIGTLIQVQNGDGRILFNMNGMNGRSNPIQKPFINDSYGAPAPKKRLDPIAPKIAEC